MDIVNENLPISEYAGPIIFKYAGPIILIENRSDVSIAVKTLRREKVLGLDVESKPSFVRGVKSTPALLQLAGEGVVFLFRIHKCGIPNELADLLVDRSIIKAGIGIREDFKVLRSVRSNLVPEGVLDLEIIARAKGFKEKSLRKLFLEVMLMNLWKPKSIAKSNWCARSLSPQQKVYGANDAMAGRVLALKLLAGELGCLNCS